MMLLEEHEVLVSSAGVIAVCAIFPQLVFVSLRGMLGNSGSTAKPRQDETAGTTVC